MNNTIVFNGYYFGYIIKIDEDIRWEMVIFIDHESKTYPEWCFRNENLYLGN